MAERKLRLLCLDGGGVRGLSSLFILKQLMETVNPETPPKPCNYFDMIAGTSTGGLIAVMLGRLKMDIDRCIDVYTNMMDSIFKKERHRINIKGSFQARFSTEELERAIKKAIVDSGLPVDASMRYRGSDVRECKVFVCAVSGENRNLTVEFSSYNRNLEANSELFNNVKIWEACRATSAATTFFEPIKIGRNDQVFLDGATSANNPVQKLWLEAEEIWGGSLDTKVQSLISIGTGIGEVAPFGNDTVSIANTFKAIATETERTANEFRRGHRDLDDRNAYYRFNVNKGLEKVGLEDARSRTKIASMTQAYMTEGETMKALRQFQTATKAANVPYIPLKPRPRSSAFLALDDSPKFLQKDAESYWGHLTMDALGVYESIYEACADQETGLVSYPRARLVSNQPTVKDFHQQFDGNRPHPKLIPQMWQRIDRPGNSVLPKNLTLAVLYMLHVESFIPNHEPKPIGLNRRKILECYGNWVFCACGCSRKWNFANGPEGLRRDGSMTKECKVTKWKEAGTLRRKLFMMQRGTTTEPEFLDQNRKNWLRDRQFARPASPVRTN